MPHIYFHCSTPHGLIVDRCGSQVEDIIEACDRAEQIVHTLIAGSSSLLKNPSSSRVCRDSVFLSRIGGGWHAGRICGSERAVFVYRARGAGADEPSA